MFGFPYGVSLSPCGSSFAARFLVSIHCFLVFSSLFGSAALPSFPGFPGDFSSSIGFINRLWF